VDTEIRRLEQRYQQTGDPLLWKELDTLRGRAALPISLSSVVESIRALEERIQKNLRASLEYELAEYMRKYGSVVEHLRWQQMDNWEITHQEESIWIDSIRIMFLQELRMIFFDEDVVLRTLDETGEITPTEDSREFRDYVSTHPKLKSQKDLLIAAVKDAEILEDHLRALTEPLGKLLGTGYVIYNNQLQIIDDDAEFIHLIDSLSPATEKTS